MSDPSQKSPDICCDYDKALVSSFGFMPAVVCALEHILSGVHCPHVSLGTQMNSQGYCQNSNKQP